MKRLCIIVMALFFVALAAKAQSRGGELVLKDSSGAVVGSFNEAHALVVGESEYADTKWGRLPGVKEDVVAVRRLFGEMGFNVVTLEDANRRSLRDGIEGFLNEYGHNKDSRLVIYFAGHGHTLDLGKGRKMGYIVPVDAPHPDRGEQAFIGRAIPMSQFDTWAKNSRARHILFMFDSCFSGTVFDTSRGAVSPAVDGFLSRPVRQFITSGDADEKVPDVSIFRRQLEYALRDGLADPDKSGYVSGTALGMYLYTTVTNYSNGRQHPQFGKLNHVDLDKGDFVFAVGTPSTSVTPPPAPKPAPVTPAAQSERPPTSANFIRINGGTFTMGSPANEPERSSSETQHQVRVSSFSMNKYQVTQKEWVEVMGSNPSNFKGDNLPVECVSWYEAIEYCNKRSQKEGLTQAYTIDKSRSDVNNKSDYDDVRWVVTWNRSATGYRLPTEAEWEYACRAGTTTPFNLGNNITTYNANYNGNFPYSNNPKGEYREKTTPVGSFAANPWGLYDMHGNVYEWCWDWYGNYSSGEQSDPLGASSGSSRVLRGGGWIDDGQSLRSAYRGYIYPNYRIDGIGFRLVRP